MYIDLTYVILFIFGFFIGFVVAYSSIALIGILMHREMRKKND